MHHEKIVIAGAGPAGMGCAHTLSNAGKRCFVIDKNSQPGGICRTLDYNGYLFDIGGHRFLTKSAEVKALWAEVMGKDLRRVKRVSRIYYRKRFLDYPLSFGDTVLKLGVIESALCLLSYIRRKIFPLKGSDDFETWVTNNFGTRLYRIFFESYTRKVWAAPCKDISADWARQRIRGLSLRVAIKNLFLKDGEAGPKTLSDEFYYPATGPGEFYERLKDRISALGSEFHFCRRLRKVRHDGKRVVAVSFLNELDGVQEEMETDHFFSSIPLPELIGILDPLPPAGIRDAANALRFRDFITVNVILDTERVFSDQWIYVQDPGLRMGRIQNYKNWSPLMVPDMNKTSLGLEYFCNKDDSLSSLNDVDLIGFALGELERLGIAKRRHFISGFVVRQDNAYPFYSMGYSDAVAAIRDYLSGFTNFQTIGRAGLFRYDNSDHALLTGIYAARNLLGEDHCDIWSMNREGVYIES